MQRISWNSYRMGFLVSALLILLSTGAFFGYSINKESPAENTITFFDVGQGDSILIQTKQGHDILIDGGPTKKVLEHVQKELGMFDKHIDVMIATHPDLDHVGGLSHVLASYSVGTLLVSGHPATTTPALTFAAAVKKAVEQGRIGTTTSARRGDVITSGDVIVQVLFPDREITKSWDANTASIIVKVSQGSIDALLTGDAPKMIERFLVTEGDVNDIEILKLGHHGSKTSTDPKLLDATKAQVVIVSAGKPSRYGHPHPTVMKLVQERNIPSFETGDGNIVCSLDTGQCTQKTKRSKP